MQLSVAPARRIAEPFRVSGYRSLWLGAVLAAAAQWIDRVAVGWYIFHVTDSAFLTSAAVSAQMGAGFFIGPLSGAISDRSSRPRILAAAIALRSSTIAAMVLDRSAMALLVHSEITEIGLIFALLSLGGIGQSMIFASQQTLSSDLVGADRRARAISLMSIGQRVVSAFGAVSSGYLVANFGPTVALAVAMYVSKVPVPFVDKLPQRSADQDAAETERNRNWNPNAPLSGKTPMPAGTTSPTGTGTGAEGGSGGVATMPATAGGMAPILPPGQGGAAGGATAGASPCWALPHACPSANRAAARSFASAWVLLKPATKRKAPWTASWPPALK